MEMTRRTALAAIPAAVTSVVSPLPVLARQGDPHAGWWAEWERLKDESLLLGNLTRVCDDEYERLSIEIWEMGCGFLDKIMETPATTFEGLLVQIQMQEWNNEGPGDSVAQTLTHSMRVGIERLSGAA